MPTVSLYCPRCGAYMENAAQLNNQYICRACGYHFIAHRYGARKI